MKSEVFNMDCMIGMAQYPDKYFELALVDPPYAVGAADGNFGGKKAAPSRVGGMINAKKYTNHDITPNKHYFDELFRISKNQIIWGSNYYPQFLYHSGAIVWDKKNDKNHILSDCELAFQSYSKLVNIVRIAWGGFYKEDVSSDLKFRVHPNQKPVNLYSWIYHNYLSEGGKVIDTHLGSGSNRIAADKAGNIDFVGYEIDKDYFEAQEKRWKIYKSQLVIKF